MLQGDRGLLLGGPRVSLRLLPLWGSGGPLAHESLPLRGLRLLELTVIHPHLLLLLLLLLHLLQLLPPHNQLSHLEIVDVSHL